MRKPVLLIVVHLLLVQALRSQNVGINNAVPNAPLSFANASGNKIDLFYNSATSRYGFGIQTGLLQIFSNGSSADIAFGHGASSSFTELMRIKGNGNVGIGTLTPGYKLDINGRMRLAHDGVNSAGLWFNKTDNTEHTFAGMKADTVWGLYNAGWKFNFDMENIRLGINSATPQYPLTFQSIVGDKISLYGGGGLPNADHYGLGIQGSLLQLFSPASSTDIAFGYGRSGNFTETMRIKGNGNVGIGTSTPETPLTVNSSGLGFMHSDGTTKIATEIIATDGAIGTQTAHGLRLRTGAATRMYINATGNVGIGTFSPAYKLDVDGRIRIRHNGITAGLWLNKADNTEAVFAGMYDDTTYGVFNGSWRFAFDIKNTLLGIGIMSPTAPLSFPATLGKKISLYPGGTGAAGLGVFSNELRIHSDYSNANITLGYDNYTNGFTENVRFYGNGNIHIGKYTTWLAGDTRKMNWGDGDFVYITEDGADDRMALKASSYDLRGGDVFIGITDFTRAPGYKLRVSGKIISEEVRVQLLASWPDYVFEKNYSKLSILQLERFINEHKHLPNIPSAAEVEKNGQNLGDLQRRMMEKIEELSLYIIELKKDLDTQNAEIKTLKQRIQ